MNKELLAKLFKMAPDTGNGGGAEVGAEESSQEQAEQAQAEESNGFKAPQSQSELDSLTNKAVQKALENYKAGEQQRIAEAIKKEKDYANLSAAERAQQEFEDQQAAFAKEKAEFEHEKLVVQVEKDLVAKGLPAGFAEMLAVGDAETALAQVGKFETAFNAAVNAKVKESLRQPAPQEGGSGSSQTNYGARLAEGSLATGGELF
ncbi:DUF4355 domain-containing protein [Streptococcus hillyeri]|uniref:DUF4355 domain-containing protein n=1 Tax=Streptococcus hillyeri TaxID=2282420 RepID=A0A3L9DSR8_9STRE|nr:DUF4355 domain-containing protein [Streptococcus hillyeri]RLY03083.1 DUF4355 domain-containing protein [Streptococcus hillyeri]